VNPSVFRPILLIATLMVTVSSPAQQISCPNVLPETVQSAKSVPDGWLARNSNLKHVLNGVQINFGDPQNASDGAIYDTRKLQLEANGVELETLIWEITKISNVYLVCTYFGTNVVLTRNVAGMSRCKAVIAHRRNTVNTEIRSAICE